LEAAASDSFAYHTIGRVRVDLPGGADDPGFGALVKGIEAWKPGRLRALAQPRDQKAREDLGWLRPHLVNRSAQETLIRDYVAAALPSSAPKPGAFLLMGPEAECGDVFVHRIACHTLPAMAARGRRFIVHLGQVAWSDHRDDIEEPSQASQARAEVLRVSIQAALRGALNARAHAAVLRVELPVEDWRGADLTLLRTFLGWWQQGDPAFRVSIPLVVIVYASLGEGLIERWTRRLRLRGVTAAFATPVQSAPAPSSGAITPFPPSLQLPILQGVRETDAMDWIHQHLKELRYPDPLEARTAIALHFRPRLMVGRRRLPMNHAVRALRTLLRDNTSGSAT